MSKRKALGILFAITAGIAAFATTKLVEENRLSTGKTISPIAAGQSVGSFPCALAISPDGKFLAVTDSGFRQYISIVRVADGAVVSQLPFDRLPSGKRASLYFGLTFGPESHAPYLLLASRGPEDRASTFTLDSNGVAEDVGKSIDSARPKNAADPLFMAGIALSSTGSTLYAANNETNYDTGFKGSLSVVDVQSNKLRSRVETPGFPLAVVSVTKGPFADKKVYVSSERDSCVAVVDVSDPFNAKLTKTIATGSQPMGFALSKDQSTLYVANAGSDTVSVIDVATDRVIRTVLLRPTTARNLPGVTPTGLALSPDDQTLYVTLGDMNAVAVVNLVGRRPGLKGYIPVGWYPSAIAVAPDGSLFVANAKGDQATHPNGKNAGPNGAWGNYIQDIIDGTVAKISPLSDDDLKHATEQVIQNNGVAVNLANPNRRALPETGIRHVIYIIKENRTYDQVMGDVAEGNGDRSLTLFGSDVTPNEHALAKRFVLLDNFYCCSEVSGDGWDWSTSGMASEYTVRNVPFNYSGRGRSYDFEGDNNGMPADVDDLPDVAEAPSGYIWDAVAQKKLTYRNYGFYMNFANDDKVPAGKPKTVLNYPTKKALVGHTDLDFMKFDTDYADSDAWAKYNSPAPSQKLKYGDKGSPSRFAEWKSEFDEYVKDDNLPAFEMVRIMRDHTAGTSPRRNSPRAMVADNDYAVGQIVEAVSKSKYWKDTAIFIVEDDAQDGEDHVDAHRSPCFIVTPHVAAGTVDHHFYNTDSVLRTMEALLGLKPMCQYDAIAPVMNFIQPLASNDAPYTAILPSREIVTEVNDRTSYRAKDSQALDFSKEDQVPGPEMADILWGSIHNRPIDPRTR